ncbi:hypothetical protein JCM14469_36900 [Desulfatiferula olefinivorans]
MSDAGLKDTVKLSINKKHRIELKSVQAIILTPALGYPAIVRTRADGSAWLEMIILTKKSRLEPDEVAYHVRLTSWSQKDIPSHYSSRRLSIFQNYFLKNHFPIPVENLVKVSKCFTWTEDTFGLGTDGCDVSDTQFELKLCMSNVFDWVMKSYKEKGYEHIFKIAVNLAHEPLIENNLYNVIWLEKEAMLEIDQRPSIAKVIRGYLKSKLPDIVFTEDGTPYGALKMKLSDFGKGPEADSAEDIRVSIYAPVYRSSKNEFNIGHITDIHLDTRMDVYAQSEASVIEVKANCGEHLTFDANRRIVADNELHAPLKNKVANFNAYFKDICRGLFEKGADCLVVTGDLVDYNRGLHTTQTFKKTPEKPGKTWSSLNVPYNKHEKDRNWFLFYQVLLSLYDDIGKPIFTVLGNHDYVKYAMSPWPLGGTLWNGVYDQNLTRYESALMFGRHDFLEKIKPLNESGLSLGPGYNSPVEFLADGFEHISCVQWYSYFINPFADFVVDLGKQSLFMVDWGCTSDIKMSVLKGSGGLHHAANLFKDKMDFGKMVDTENGREYKKNFFQAPFLIRNYSIYWAWVNSHFEKIKILFMHATAICPKDDVSEWELENIYGWDDGQLQYGSFDEARIHILRAVEQGRLNMIVSGHSHRNIVMEVKDSRPDKVRLLSAGEIMDTGAVDPKHIVMVSSSAGPLPKYLPGAPKICGCDPKKHQKYKTGYYHDGRSLFTIDDKKKTLKIKGSTCPDCKMPISKMMKKPPARHKPGGNVLTFEDGKVRIQTVVVSDSRALPSKPRKGPLCEEWGVMTDDMVLEGVDNKIIFGDLDKYDLIDIISRKPFIRYNHMEFPTTVKYANYELGNLAKLVKNSSVDTVHEVPENGKPFWIRISQTVIKKIYTKLMISAKSNQSMTFMRYLFSDNDAWDREIKITKNVIAQSKDLYEEGKIRTINAIEKTKAFFSDYEPKLLKAKYDPFEGLIIEFKTEPDFKKRKNPNVCGY